MEARLAVISILVSLGLLCFVFEMVRRRKLKERYSLLWFSTAVVLLVLSLSKGLMHKVSLILGIYYPPSAFFLLAFLFLMLISLQFSSIISKLSDRNKTLTEELVLLTLRVETLERQSPTK